MAGGAEKPRPTPFHCPPLRTPLPSQRDTQVGGLQALDAVDYSARRAIEGVDPRGPPRGNERGHERHDRHERDHRRANVRGSRALTPNRMFADGVAAQGGEGEGQAEARPAPPASTCREPCRSTMPQDAAPVGAEGHAHAELLRPLAHRERRDAVDADGGQHHRHHAEDREHRGHDAVRGHEAVEVLLAGCPRSRAAGSRPPCCTWRRSAVASVSARWPPRGFTITVANWLDERLGLQRGRWGSSRTGRRSRCRPRSGC